MGFATAQSESGKQHGMGRHGGRRMCLLLTLYQLESREQTGGGVGLQVLEACHQWPTSFRQTPPHKGSTTFHNSASSWEQVFKHISLWGTVQVQTTVLVTTILPMVGVKSWLTLSSLVTKIVFLCIFIGYSHIIFGEMFIETLCPLWSRSFYWVIRVFCTHQIQDFQHTYNLHTFPPILRFVVSFLRVLFTRQKYSFEEDPLLFSSLLLLAWYLRNDGPTQVMIADFSSPSSHKSFIFFFHFWARISLCSWGWPWNQVLAIKMYTTMPGFSWTLRLRSVLHLMSCERQGKALFLAWWWYTPVHYNDSF